MVKTRKGENYSPTYGGFMPSQRYYIDQSPLAFAINTKKTYNDDTIKKQRKQKQNHIDKSTSAWLRKVAVHPPDLLSS